MAPGTGLPRLFQEPRRVARAPGKLLRRFEQQRQKRRPNPGRDPREDDREPEAQRAGIAKRRRDLRVGRRRSGVAGGGL